MLEKSELKEICKSIGDENNFSPINAYKFVSALNEEVKNCLHDIDYYSENELMYSNSFVFTEVLNTINKINSFILLRLEKGFHCYREFNLIKIKDQIYISLEGFLQYDNNSNKFIYPTEIFKILFFGSDFTIPFEGKTFISLNRCDCIKKEILMHNKKSKLKLENKSLEKRKTYLMIDENTGFYKIGYSKNVQYREKTLQSEKPVIKLLFYCDNFIETELHKKYKSQRIRGEYFDLSDDDVINIYELFKANGIHISNYKK